MNLDLSKLTKKELQDELAKCSDNHEFLMNEFQTALGKYQKLINKRFVRPINLSNAKTLSDSFKTSMNFVDAYSRILLDEANKRITTESK